MAEHLFKQRSGLVYLGAAAVITVIRISVLLYVNHRMASHTVTRAVGYLAWFLRPEGILVAHLPFKILEVKTLYYAVFCLFLAIGSFVISIPALFVGSRGKVTSKR